MFADFFYLLRRRGLDVSLNEWLTLLEGMEQGLHRSSLTGFYQLCRAVLVKSEAEYDRFDQVFLEYFRDIPWKGELPEELLNWLEHPAEDLRRTIEQLRAQGLPDKSLQELLDLLEQRLQEQTEEHNGGSYWVGTQGPFPLWKRRLASRRHPHRGRGPLPHGHDCGGGAEVPGFPPGQHFGYPSVSNRIPHAAPAFPSRRTVPRRCWTWTAPSGIPATMPGR